MRASAARWLRRALAVVVMAGAAILAGGTPAMAHPFGDPQTVAIGAEGEVVRVDWRVGGMDDLTLLGIELGVLPTDRVLLDGAIMFADGDAEAVAGSEEFRSYLLDRIEVDSDGSGCAGEVAEVGDLAQDAARLEFTCAAPVSSASVTVRTLTDLHPAYRTLATGPDGQRAVYEQSADTHDFTLGGGTVAETSVPAEAPATAAQDVGRSAAAQLGAVAGVALLVVVAGALVLRRRTRHHQPHTS